jgi:hypothetical protein
MQHDSTDGPAHTHKHILVPACATAQLLTKAQHAYRGCQKQHMVLDQKYGNTVSAAAGWAAPQPKGMLACLRHLGSAEPAAAQIHGGCAPTKTLNPQQCDIHSTNTRKQQTAIWSSDTWRALGTGKLACSMAGVESPSKTATNPASWDIK